MELFEHIRKEHYLAKKSIRQVAKQYKIHRRTVRQAIKDPVPPNRLLATMKTIVITGTIKHVIDEWLVSDRNAPKKQRHTAQRIFTRLIEEYQFQGKLPTIKKYIGKRRRELGLKQEGFIPLAYAAGEEAEVDWYEAYVNFPFGKKQKVYFFEMRACFSGREFHMAFPRCTQQAFLEAHVKAFNYFGGVFKNIRYDNLRSAVSKVLRGRKREESEHFTTMRSHYLFNAIFCRPGKSGAHEKGGVECGVGRFRRQHLVPVPTFDDFDVLNKYLMDCCTKDDQRKIIGKNSIIQQDWQQEQSKLLPLAKKSFNYCETRTCEVNTRSLITLNTQRYSVPVRLIGQRITIQLSSQKINCYYQGKCVAEHALCNKPYEIKTVLDHYLELLWTKPGAWANALPRLQARENNKWPKEYDCFWQHLVNRYGQYEGTRQLIDVLFLHRHYDSNQVKNAVATALTLGWYSIDGVKQLVSKDCPDPKSLFQSCHKLTGFCRSESESKLYDQLLQGGYNHVN